MVLKKCGFFVGFVQYCTVLYAGQMLAGCRPDAGQMPAGCPAGYSYEFLDSSEFSGRTSSLPAAGVRPASGQHLAGIWLDIQLDKFLSNASKKFEHLWALGPTEC